MKKIVITYEHPDLDCVSSAYAYSEYLNKIGENADYYIKGNVKKDAEVVLEMFDIVLAGTNSIYDDDSIIVVDTNSLSDVSYVRPNNIVEIIDHHPDTGDRYLCKNAVSIIESVGAVATIIAEKFRDNNVEISREAAILLYYGIISNSVNLKANITSDRDKIIIDWLESKCSDINRLLVAEIFRRKSFFDIANLRREMEVEIEFDVCSKRLVIGQLEIVDVDDFLSKYRENIENILRNVQIKKNLDYVFINMIDILNGYHVILTLDLDTEKFLFERVGYRFKEHIYRENKIVQRKDIKRLLKK
ncbi:MAG: DHH family phosphoesterase [Bacilli bacterium]|nr:DHH family phosphoesterase [Bacilli bacterium]